MNTHTAANNEAAVTTSRNVVRNYRPALSFYHANGKGTGSAAKLEVVPATGSRDGAVFLTLARQKSVASGSAEQGNRQHATFDWENRITVKLNFGDLCQMLPVFKGQTGSIANGKGLFHDTRTTTTIINLANQTEPFPGCALDLSRKNHTGDDDPVRTRILFNASESYGLGTALEQTLSLIAFGIPRDHRPGASTNGTESPDSDEPTTADE